MEGGPGKAQKCLELSKENKKRSSGCLAFRVQMS